ncbi:replication/maintenance protein RepL [uncultured Fusobacterium sp.]|jgi:DNA-binding HxlR family transcriptional regulator|uniref:replication/maintenance protein RepL n=1 Tax=uncultured Fusobacterium sp. TaxID=159267 RepID=UPI0015A718CB|nr:replication/maintenance protein RepL [uncultured Fusobacterium sp.]
MNKDKTTRKKVKIIGKETYIKQDTGEITDMQVINIEERDFNFHKIWLEHILTSIDIIGNQKTRLAFWIMNNLDKENRLIMTQRMIAEKTKMSTKTVTETLKALISSNFLQKVQSGVYRVNPNIVFKGGKNQRIDVLLQYRAIEDGDGKDNDKN